MRKTIAAVVLVTVVAVSFVRSAAAGPEDSCLGSIVSGIAATWPWAHDGQSAFPPPPGAIPLWIKTFGPGIGVSSVRDLQRMFCKA